MHLTKTMCTLEKRGSLFMLTLTSDDDQHRLNPTLISSILSALSQIKSQATAGSALVTVARGASGRFFCNGFDFHWARAAGTQSGSRDRLRHMADSFRQVVAEFISLPMPTVAAVSGHAAAAGLVLAIAHDYLVMRSDRGVLYMPEVDLGITVPDYFAAAARAKIGSTAALRDVLAKGVKVRAKEAVEMGMVHSVHDSVEGTVESAVRLGEELAGKKWVGEVYAEIRKSLYPEMCSVLGLTPKSIISNI